MASTDEQQRRTLLVVDDIPEASEHLIKCLEQEWMVKKVPTPGEALDTLTMERDRFQAVLVDLGLPDKPNDLDVGTALIENIRSKWDDLPLAGYTEMTRAEAEITRRLLLARASFFMLRRAGAQDAMCKCLRLICDGYLVYSPGPAAVVPAVIAPARDPLNGNEILWVALQRIARHPDKSIEQIEQDENMGRGTLQDQLERIKKLLGEVLPEPTRKALFNWYEENHLRYEH